MATMGMMVTPFARLGRESLMVLPSQLEMSLVVVLISLITLAFIQKME